MTPNAAVATKLELQPAAGAVLLRAAYDRLASTMPDGQQATCSEELHDWPS